MGKKVVIYVLVFCLLISLVVATRFDDSQSSQTSYSRMSSVLIKYPISSQLSRDTFSRADIGQYMCLSNGCYDSDPLNDPNKAGTVWLRHQKDKVNAYCSETKDVCKDYTIDGQKQWFVFDYSCNQIEIEGKITYDITNPIHTKCEGKCASGACLPATCSDGILNQGEEEVDCGGPCDSCIKESCTDEFGITKLNYDAVLVTDINGNEINVFDECSDDKTQLIEKVCDGNSLSQEFIDCPFGCNAGACLEKTECDDPDGGINEFESATTTGWNNDFTNLIPSTDKCFSGEYLANLWGADKFNPEKKYLREHYCKEDGKLASEMVECPGECFAGSCTTTNEEQNSCPHVDQLDVTQLIDEGSSAEMTMQVSDLDNDELECSWYVDGTPKGNDCSSFTFQEDPGKYSLDVSVSDGQCTLSYPYGVTVQSLGCPLGKVISNVAQPVVGYPVTFTVDFDEPTSAQCDWYVIGAALAEEKEGECTYHYTPQVPGTHIVKAEISNTDCYLVFTKFVDVVDLS